MITTVIFYVCIDSSVNNANAKCFGENMCKGFIYSPTDLNGRKTHMMQVLILQQIQEVGSSFLVPSKEPNSTFITNSVLRCISNHVKHQIQRYHLDTKLPKYQQPLELRVLGKQTSSMHVIQLASLIHLLASCCYPTLATCITASLAPAAPCSSHLNSANVAIFQILFSSQHTSDPLI